MLRRSILVVLILTGMLSVLNISNVAASSNDEVYAAKIREALHAVVQAAKEFQLKTGNEARSLDDLKAANLLKIQDKRQTYVINDNWQVWGDKTGSYIMWDEVVTPEVCKLINDDHILPTDPSGKPLKDRGLQCIFYASNGYYVLEPVYIHGE